MIPKIIHYCWFGRNPLPETTKEYIKTWKKYCPDYEIIEWNENNFDMDCCIYVREAYEAKKWAFISDYVRLKVLYEHGGIYMDTDVEVCKSFDDLLGYSAWSGFESDSCIPTGTMASDKQNEWIGNLLKYYDGRHFKNENGDFDLTTNVVTITKITKEIYNINLNNKRQVFGNNYLLLPFEYLCAKSLENGKIYKTNNTYTIHHFNGSWLTPWMSCRHKFKLILVKIFGVAFVNKIKLLLK